MLYQIISVLIFALSALAAPDRRQTICAVNHRVEIGIYLRKRYGVTYANCNLGYYSLMPASSCRRKIVWSISGG